MLAARRLWWLSLLATAPFARAQDDIVLASPDKQIQFRLFVTRPPQGDELVLPRLAYQMMYRGKLVMDTSFLGFAIQTQVPKLGENVALITPANKPQSGSEFNSVLAEFMQNGSLGRLLSVELRIHNDRAMFRYFIPQSPPMMDVLIEDEETEFHFAQAPRQEGAVFQLSETWVSISESKALGYATMSLTRRNEQTWITRLARLEEDRNLAVKTKSPMATSWRVIRIGPSQQSVLAP